MKEKGKGLVIPVLLAAFLLLTVSPEMVAEEGTSGQLEWIALAASSLWALFLQVLRLK